MAKCVTDGCAAEQVGKSRYCAEHRAEAHRVWLSRVREGADEQENRDSRWSSLWAEAEVAGRLAGAECTPRPMVVQAHANQLDDQSPVVQEWHEPEGVCGFAWVTVRPGGCSFARWGVKQGVFKSAYGGGVSYWVSGYGQSMARKEAYARAAAAILARAGVKAYAGSRMD